MINWQHLHDIGKSQPDFVTVCKMYNRLPEHSAFCSYAIDMHARYWDPRWKICPTCRSEELSCFTAKKLPRSVMFNVMIKPDQNGDD